MKFNEALDLLQVYEAGKPIELVVREYCLKAHEVIKLASNENPYGTAQKVRDCMLHALTHVHFYPDDSMYELKKSLAEHFHVVPEEIIIGAGSDQVIDLAIRAKCKKNDSILMAGITFAMYEIYGRAIGANIVRTQNEQHNLDEFKALYKKHNPKVIFICSPNNPLGEALEVNDIVQFLQEIDSEVLVVIDGAYQEYAAFKDRKMKIVPTEIIKQFPNILYLGTFSKVYGLGGMRIGYGIAQKEIIKYLYKLRPPFNVTTLSLVAANQALKEQDFIEYSLKNCFEQMGCYEDFCQERGIEYIPSYANFITMKLGKVNSTTLSEWLLSQGVIVRNLASYNINAIRITIGTQEHNKRLLLLLKEFYETY